MEIDPISVAGSAHVFVSFAPLARMDLKWRAITPNAVREDTGLAWPEVRKNETGVILKVPSANKLFSFVAGNAADLCGIGDCPRDPGPLQGSVVFWLQSGAVLS
jgi:hypothetical protein